MRHGTSFAQRLREKPLLIWTLILAVIVMCLIFSACTPDAGINGNGSSNGVDNNSNNSTGNCNGSNITCNINNSAPTQGNTSYGGGNVSGTTQQPSQGNQITNTSYAKGECVTVTTRDNEDAVVTGDVTINGNPYYDNDPTTGALDIINSNETVNICGEVGGFNLQTNIPSNELQSVVSNDENYMEHNSGCGSTCNRVIPNNV